MRIWGLVLALASAGCGGSNTAATEVLPSTDLTVRAFQADYAADQAFIASIAGDPTTGAQGMAGTVWDVIPNTGSAIFRGAGVGNVAADATSTAVTMRGEVFLTVNFGTDDIRGGMTRISAFDGTTTYDVEEMITFQNGDIGVGRPTQFTLDYLADLDVGGADYALDGTMDGLLRGTRLNVTRRSPVRAVSAEDLDGVVNVDGIDRTFTLQIAAENN